MRLEVMCENKTGITRKLLEILERYDLNLYGMEANSDGVIHVHFPELEFERFKNLMPEIRKLDHVIDVRTVKNMPLETEHSALDALPDPVFFIDLKGKVTRINKAASAMINLEKEKVENELLNQWILGFSFTKWVDEQQGENQTVKIQVCGINYLAEISPIYLNDTATSKLLSGGIVLLKSSSRLNKQLNILQTETTPVSKIKKETMQGFEAIRAQSSAIKRTLLQANKVALLDSPILIIGEVGTGRRRIARACHDASSRKEAPFIAINCATLNKNTIHEKLFDDEQGILKRAQSGTVYLDEIAELSNDHQINLLNYLISEQCDSSHKQAHYAQKSRIICSNKKSLVKLMKAGKFRQDLLYQINECTLSIPALRKSKDDIISLAKYFLQHYSDKQGDTEYTLSKKSCEKLQNYDWPGNVKELKNIIFQAVSMMGDNTELTPEVLSLPLDTQTPVNSIETFNDTLEQATKKYQADLIRQLYPVYPSTRKLAKKLGVSHTAIANKLKEYGIDKP